MAEPELDPTRVRFDPLQGDDLPLLHAWLHREHVAAWWRERPTYAEVVAEYTPCIAGETPTRCYLVIYEDAPIGYIQRYRLADEPDYARAVTVAEDAVGVDLFIGEARYLHRGLGSAALRRFVCEIVFAAEDVVSCIIGPEPANRAAIRAYEKVGFRYLKTIRVPGEETPEYLMRLGREDLTNGGPQ